MIISVNWLKKFTDIDLPINELATLIGARLVEIEEVIDLGAKYKGVIIARVAECKKHEDSDHLNVTKLDDGGVTPNVERDENGYVQVVCGAPNVREGLLVAWLPPSSTVPETASDVEPFVLAARKLRGVMSNGMIASARELDLFDDHTGILEIDKEVAPGTSFAEAYELDDYLLDIENKSLTHRPDCFGIIGFAREVAAIQDKQFHTPEWLKAAEPTASSETAIAAPSVTIDSPELSDRYQAVILTGAKEAAVSPLQIQTYLARVGVRPINAVVDVTNYLMMLTGQPLHAFDYDKLLAMNEGKADIHVRAGRTGETLALLDGRTITLTPDDIVIANGEKAVALAGAMGGAETEIDGSTKTIILESATFNLYSLRATQMRHGIFSEAITRFTKGQPAELTAPVLKNAIQMLHDFADATQASDIAEVYPGKKQPSEITLDAAVVNGVLGSNYTVEDMLDTLQHVEFEATMTCDDKDLLPGSDGCLHVVAPYWRSDIHIPEDVIEEVGRINGFDTIEPVLPLRDFTAVRPSDFDAFRSQVRQALVRAGANEVLTYSFIHGDALVKAGQKQEDSYKIVNSISPDLQYYRQTLTPSLLATIHPNIKQGYDSFAVFELNKVSLKQQKMTEENVPKEVNSLALAITSRQTLEDASYYQAKKMLDYLMKTLGIQLSYQPIQADLNYPVVAPFEHRRAALVMTQTTAATVGIIGEYKKSVGRSFKLPDATAGFELDMGALFKAALGQKTQYAPLSRYQGTERDICFQVDSHVLYGTIVSEIEQVLARTTLQTSISPIDIYQPENETKKNVTIRIKLTATDHTLSGDEAAVVVASVVEAVSASTGAKVI